MSTPDEINKIIEELILQGAVEVSGLDMETGEPLYGFTEKLKDVSPELASGIEELFHMHVMALWELGFLDMNPTEANPLVRLTNFADDEAAIDSLHPDLRQTLRIIKSRFSQDI
jgi:hypothetical protein